MDRLGFGALRPPTERSSGRVPLPKHFRAKIPISISAWVEIREFATQSIENLLAAASEAEDYCNHCVAHGTWDRASDRLLQHY